MSGMRHGKGQRSTIPTIMVGVAQVFASTSPVLELELELEISVRSIMADDQIAASKQQQLREARRKRILENSQARLEKLKGSQVR